MSRKVMAGSDEKQEEKRGEPRPASKSAQESERSEKSLQPADAAAGPWVPAVVRNCCCWASRCRRGGAGWRGGEMMEAGRAGGRDERVPQWGAQETRELIAARGEIEREAVAARRSAKTMWEAVVARLRERGYRRTADQCKCKWKNLVNRYKGKETSDPDNGRQCPFFEELHAVFTERARNMQRQLLESESGASVKKKLKRPSGNQSSEESDDEEGCGEETEDDKPMHSRKRRADDKRQQPRRITEKSKTGTSSIHELLQDFLVQQQHIDMQWREMTEKRAQERLLFEQEWRQTMQKLEQERLMLEHSWIEREEQRRMREDARAEKRDALLTTLLNKLLQEDL